MCGQREGLRGGGNDCGKIKRGPEEREVQTRKRKVMRGTDRLFEPTFQKHLGKGEAASGPL